MTRDIKFREWDPVREKLYGTGLVEMTRVDFDDSVSFYSQHHEIDDVENRVLEQYTGMTDANGVEIYEGDIVQTETGELQAVAGIKPVYIYEGIYTLAQTTKSIHDEIFILDSTDIVVGNIHEDPELLKHKCCLVNYR